MTSVWKLGAVLALSALCITHGAAAQGFPRGTFKTTGAMGPITVSFDDSNHVTLSMNGQVMLHGSAAVTGSEVAFTDVSGQMACPATQVGHYKWALQGNTLTFTLVSDECQGRAQGITAAPWTREAPGVRQDILRGAFTANGPTGPVTMRFGDGGRVTVHINGVDAAESMWVVQGDEVSITAIAGPMACPADNVGRYKWALRGDTLTFGLIADDCARRVQSMSQLWMREAAPPR